MFPLHLREWPGDAAALAKALALTISEFVSIAGDAVQIEAPAYPSLDFLRVNLDGATWRGSAPRPAPAIGETKPALTAAEVEIRGRGLRLESASLDFALSARDVQFHQGRDARDEIVLILQDARDGHVEFSTSQRDLESAITRLAKIEAAKQGVNVESAKLQIQARTNRSVTLQIELRAKKLFLTAVVRIRGQLDIDESLAAKISGLTCAGDGPLGALASGVLIPHLQRLEGRVIELMALPLGEVRLRDVQIEAGERIAIHARFGGAADAV